MEENETTDNEVLNSYHNEYLAREILSKTLIKYLDNLSEEGKKLLSLNIITKFSENKSIERIKRAKSLFIIYSRNYNLEKLNKKKEILYKWKRLCETNINMSSTFNSRSFSIIILFIIY
jgi:hypothetical protein